MQGPPHPGPGELGGRYVLLRELGAGGMGRVYAAHDKALGRDVAVKVLRESFEVPSAIARFEQEAKAAGSLNHPNVLTVFDIGWKDGQPFIVTELLVGSTLKQLLHEGPLTSREASSLALQLAAGLAAAHARGIVHRDIKPANLFVVGGERLKILDFGVAKLLQHDDPEEALTDTGRAVGTVAYMSPEQVRAQPITDRSDVFSFGLVLYEMLAGRRPFVRPTSVATAYAITADEPEPLPGGLPVRLVKLLEACLRKEPGKRPAIGAALGELQQLASTSTVAMTPLYVPILSKERLLGRTVRSPLVVATAAAAVVVLAVALGLAVRALWPREHRPPLQGTIAAFPFALRPDTEATYLGEGMVDLLSTALDTAGVRGVSPRRAVQAARQEKNSRAAAARLGAVGYLTGTVEGAKGQPLRLTLELHDTADGWLRLRVTAEADAAEPLKALRLLVAQVLPQVVAAGGPSKASPSYSASEEALRAFLEAEALLRHSEWTKAAAAFQRAVAADHEFALAHYRLAVTVALREPGLAADSVNRALQSRQRLSPTEAALAEAFSDFLAGRVASAEQDYQALLTRTPEDVETHFQLGELLFHWNPLRGRSSAEAAERFNETVVLDPRQGPALVHLIDLAEMSGGKALALALADRYLESAEGDETAGLLPFRWVRTWAAGDPAGREKIYAELQEHLEEVPNVLTRSYWEGDGFASARRLAAILLSAPETNVRHAYGLFALAVLDLAQGRPASARAEMAKAVSLTSDAGMRYYAAWLETQELAQATPLQLATARKRALEADFSHSPALEPYRLHVAGVLALRMGDVAAASAHAAALEKAQGIEPDSVRSDLARDLRAELAFSRGDADEAWRHLDSQRLQIPYRTSGLFAHVAPRLLRARLLDLRGQPREAARVLSVSHFYDFLTPAERTQALLYSAPLLEKAGEPAAAASQYRELAALLQGCEPELQPRLQQALAAADRLEHKPPR